MRNRVKYVALGLGVALSAASAGAAVNVVNGDFNTQTALPGSAFGGEIIPQGYALFDNYNGDATMQQQGGATVSQGINVPGWRGDVAPAGVIDYPTTSADAADTHDDYGWVNFQGSAAFLFQNIGTSDAGVLYTLNAELAGIGADCPFVIQIFEGITDPGDGSPGDPSTGTLLASLGGIVPGATFPGVFFPAVAPPVAPAAGGKPLQIRLINNGGIQLLADNVSVVPEPASAGLLLLLGTPAMLRRRCRSA